MQSMRIAYLSSFREHSIGGENRVAVELAAEMTKAGHEVALICPGDETRLTMSEGGYRRYTVQSSGEKEVTAANLDSQNIRRINGFLDFFQPDIVHTHTYLLIGAIGQVWALRNNVPFIYTAHELPTKLSDFSAGFPLVKWVKRSWAFMATVRTFCENCSAIIALNDSALSDVHALGYEGPTFKINNGRSLALFSRLQIAPPGQQINLIFTGHILPRKNQEFLVQALRFLPKQYHLHLVGYVGHQGYYERLQAEIEHYGLDNITFSGRVEPQQVPALLTDAHVFVSASLLEVQSLAIIEALASGLPVVGLANETIDELVSERVGRRLDRDATPEQFAAAVRAVAESPEYLTLANAAREVVQVFDWSQVVGHTLAAYDAVLRSRPMRAPRVPAATHAYAGLTSMVSATVYNGWRMGQKVNQYTSFSRERW